MWARLFFVCHVFSAALFAQHVIVDFSDQESINHLSFKEDLFVIDTLSYSPVTVFSQGEFEYLTELTPGKQVTQKLFLDGLKALEKKHCFKTVTITYDTTEKGISLDYAFELYQTIKTIKVKGVGLGSEKYVQAYGLYSGDIFKHKKHFEGIGRLKEALKKEGYFGAVITDTLYDNTYTSQTDVVLHCKKGKRFTVAEAKTAFIETDTSFSDEIKQHVVTFLDKQLTGQKYSEKLVTQVTKELKQHIKYRGYTKTKIMLHARVVPETHELYITFSFTPLSKREFVFLGNNFFSHTELLECLFRFGDSLPLLSVSLCAQDIKAHYYKKGFWRLLIEGHEEHETSFFVIKEGPRVSINQVQVKTEQKTLSDAQVKKFFAPLLKARYFDADIFQHCTQRLLSWYRDNGYAEAAILRRMYHAIKEDKEYSLEIVIDEGHRSVFKEEVINGYPDLIAKGPFVNSAPEKVYTHDLLKDHKFWLQNYFKKKGYLWVNVSYEIHKEDEGDIIVWTIKKGDPLVFGKTIVQGIAPVSYKTLLQMAQYKEGSLWNKRALQETQRRCKTLDVFKQIAFYPDPTYSRKSKKDILVQLEEDNFFEIRARLGFSQISKNLSLKKGSTYKVGGTLFFRNVTGHADIIRSDVDVTRFERKFSALYETPYVFDSPCSLTTKVYAHNYTQPLNAATQKTLYKTNQDGFLTTLAFKKRTFTLGFTCGCEWGQTKELSQDLADAIDFQTTLVDKKIPSLFIEPNLCIDLLDNKLEPTKGCYVNCFIKAMTPLKDEGARFVKFLCEQGIFFPLIKHTNIITGLRFKFGHIFRQSFSSIMPPDRFYLGGANSLRGYLPDRCPPLTKYADESGEILYVPQGGKTLLNMNIELRIPIFKQMSFALFQDFGVLTKSFEEASDTKKQLAATGCGLRFMTPFGPLRFDVGFKWKKDYPEDKRYAWFLTFGHAF